MVGMNKGFSPKFLRRYLDLYTEITGAVAQYVKDVKTQNFLTKTKVINGSSETSDHSGVISILAVVCLAVGWFNLFSPDINELLSKRYFISS
jgi:hypothetical protein